MDFQGLELFLDDERISNVRNIRRAIHRPTEHDGNPLVRREFPWEARHVCIYGSVLYDEAKQCFRMWYNGIGEDYYNRQHLCYAESPDGETWTKPMLDLNQFAGHEKTNMLMGNDCNLHGPGVIVNPDPNDHDRRYLMLFDSYPQWRPDAEALGIRDRWCYSAESPDGLHWSPAKGRPAFAGKADSGQSVVWDPVSKMFRAYVRLTALDAFGQRIRIWRLVESPDFVSWGQPMELLRADEEDGYPDMQIQQLTVTRYDGIYIGLLSLFPVKQLVSVSEHGGLNEGPQINDIQLITSRDGIHFTRVADRALFMPHVETGFGTHGFRTASQMLLHHDTVYIYCDGRSGDWKSGGMEVGLFTLPRDRFAAVAPYRLIDDALVELVPLVYPQADLRLNFTTTPAGKVEAEVADFVGNTIEGFTRADSVTLSEGGLDEPLRWRREGTNYSLEALPQRVKDQPVRLRLWLRQANVYSLRARG